MYNKIVEEYIDELPLKNRVIDIYVKIGKILYDQKKAKEAL